MKSKKFFEALVASIFIQFLKKEQSESFLVGFPLRGESQQGNSNSTITILDLFKKNSTVFEDSDVDICIGNDKEYRKCQIAGFVDPPLYSRRNKTSLIDLVRKKCLNQVKDPDLDLIILLESPTKLDGPKFHKMLNEVTVPFDKISLIVKASAEEGHFRLYQAHPEQRILNQVKINLPL